MKENDKNVSEERFEDKNINTESQKLTLSKKNKINSMNSSENILLEEQKIFECELINKRRINRINLIIDERKRNIQIKLYLKNKNIEDSIEKDEEYIHLKTINQIDFISFMSQEDLDDIKLSQIKNLILTSLDNNKEKSELLDDKEICSLTYFP